MRRRALWFGLLVLGLAAAGTSALGSEHPAEEVKVLGFTMGVPVSVQGVLPESAKRVAWTDDGAYAVWAADHRYCGSLRAVSDRDHGVFYVRCGVGGMGGWWERSLRMRYGKPATDRTVAHMRPLPGQTQGRQVPSMRRKHATPGVHLVHVYRPNQYAFIERDDDSVYWLSKHGPVDHDLPAPVPLDCMTQEGPVVECWDREERYTKIIWHHTAAALSKASEIETMAVDQTVARESEGEDF